jgi:hypothetical protein
LGKGAHLGARDAENRTPLSIAQTAQDTGLLQVMSPYIRVYPSR